MKVKDLIKSLRTHPLDAPVQLVNGENPQYAGVPFDRDGEAHIGGNVEGSPATVGDIVSALTDLAVGAVVKLVNGDEPQHVGAIAHDGAHVTIGAAE